MRMAGRCDSLSEAISLLGTHLSHLLHVLFFSLGHMKASLMSERTGLHRLVKFAPAMTLQRSISLDRTERSSHHTSTTVGYVGIQSFPPGVQDQVWNLHRGSSSPSHSSSPTPTSLASLSPLSLLRFSALKIAHSVPTTRILAHK